MYRPSLRAWAELDIELYTYTILCMTSYVTVVYDMHVKCFIHTYVQV